METTSPPTPLPKLEPLQPGGRADYLSGLIAVVFFAINALFALGYFLDGGIENVHTGSFADMFFFSVQTMATIGYGAMSPATTYANSVMTAETVFGVTLLALGTGLLFARISRPTARVLFSEVAVVAPYNGVPTLMVRPMM